MDFVVNIFFAVVAVVILAVIVYKIIMNRKIRQNGMDADAVISRIEVDTSTDADGDTTTTETYYVTYVNQQGQTVEAQLGNLSINVNIFGKRYRSRKEGDKLRVKYLPEKPEYVVAVKK